MNTLTANGLSHDFSTIDELTAIVHAMPGREGITQLWRDGLRLVGYDSRPVMHVIGTLKEPVAVLPKLRAKNMSASTMLPKSMLDPRNAKPRNGAKGAWFYIDATFIEVYIVTGAATCSARITRRQLQNALAVMAKHRKV